MYFDGRKFTKRCCNQICLMFNLDLLVVLFRYQAGELTRQQCSILCAG